MSFKDEVFADYEAACRHTARGTWLRVLVGFIQYSGFRAAVIYRIGHRARRRRVRIGYRLMERVLQIFCGLDISTGAEIGGGLFLPHPRSIIIGDTVVIGARAYILQGVTFGGSGRRGADGQSQPRVGDDVLIGAGAALIGPIVVGNGVKIGANAVVNKDVPDNSTAIGNPMQIVRIGEHRLGPLEQAGELARILGDLQRRVEAIEARLR
ncbi:MAG: hypothetical protein JXO22_09250 [Phycisphaerae bacterium]|nr:hypothetical protein [Phycisphaerae bacterium]